MTRKLLHCGRFSLVLGHGLPPHHAEHAAAAFTFNKLPNPDKGAGTTRSMGTAYDRSRIVIS